MKLKYTYLFILIFAASPLLGKGAVISGFVQDSLSGESLPYADVYLEGTRWGAATNVKGFYSLAGIPAGTYTFVVSYAGYKSLKRKITLADGDVVKMNVHLTEVAEIMKAVEVTARREGGENDQMVGHHIVSRISTKPFIGKI